MTLKELEKKIANLIFNNSEFLEWSIMQIYNQQAEQEKYHNKTNEWNSKGFDKLDGQNLSPIAQYLMKGIKLKMILEISKFSNLTIKSIKKFNELFFSKKYLRTV